MEGGANYISYGANYANRRTNACARLMYHAKNKKTDYVMKDSGTNYAKLYRRKNETANAEGDF